MFLKIFSSVFFFVLKLKRPPGNACSGQNPLPARGGSPSSGGCCETPGTGGGGSAAGPGLPARGWPCSPRYRGRTRAGSHRAGPARSLERGRGRPSGRAVPGGGLMGGPARDADGGRGAPRRRGRSPVPHFAPGDSAPAELRAERR